jgi:hypothetical protein
MIKDKMDKKEIVKLVTENDKSGNVILNTIEGLYAANIDELIKQPTEGLLYDLNRDKATVLTLIDDPKWINDYAVAMVITKLKEYYDRNNNG